MDYKDIARYIGTGTSLAKSEEFSFQLIALYSQSVWVYLFEKQLEKEYPDYNMLTFRATVIAYILWEEVNGKTPDASIKFSDEELEGYEAFVLDMNLTKEPSLVSRKMRAHAFSIGVGELNTHV